MDQPTRRFDQPAPDEQTRRIDESSAAAPACLRCNTAMVATSAYSHGAYPGELRLLMRGAKSKFLAPAPTTTIDTMTCPRCGYTEFFAHSLEQLNEMIHAKQLQQEQNNNG